jgi:hypothetical protein
MACTVFVNCRGVAHKGSGGMNMAFPDVCKTQCGPAVVPIPYPNIGQCSDLTGGPETVTTDGKMPGTKDAKFSKSSGDEVGQLGGVMSNVNRGECEFMLYSFDVKFEGKSVARLGDPMFHNKKNIMG